MSSLAEMAASVLHPLRARAAALRPRRDGECCPAVSELWGSAGLSAALGVLCQAGGELCSLGLTLCQAGFVWELSGCSAEDGGCFGDLWIPPGVGFRSC